ncbi:hypothetical protein HPB51_029378 [Rhipicephalus microplus]|uniref:Uncharacterized protein n=1 Tax=Rhipicephalus microplus TaxID=6941 RepID=A0A9J6CUH0_RHIMP|nr:hypothetical protein HPB51_029378 [Rhipicephalus microplus]
MDVDEDPPGASMVSENQPNDASSVPSNEEPSNDARAPSAASLDNKNDDDAGVALTCTGDGWHTILSRRRKKNHKQSQKEPEKGLEKKNDKSAAHPPVDAALDSQVKREFQRRKCRGPTPLPKEDTKVILRPHKGLTVKKSVWIGALYGSDRGLPEQLWRRKFFAAGPPRIEHHNIVHATRTSGGQAERDQPIENQRTDSPLQCVRGRPRRRAARHRSRTTAWNHSGRPDGKPTNTATRGEDRESQDAGLFEVSNNNFYG